MMTIQSKKDADLKAVLTGDQFSKYQAHQAEMKERMMDRKAGGESTGN